MLITFGAGVTTIGTAIEPMTRGEPVSWPFVHVGTALVAVFNLFLCAMLCWSYPVVSGLRSKPRLGVIWSVQVLSLGSLYLLRFLMDVMA